MLSVGARRAQASCRPSTHCFRQSHRAESEKGMSFVEKATATERSVESYQVLSASFGGAAVSARRQSAIEPVAHRRIGPTAAIASSRAASANRSWLGAREI